MAGYPWKFWLWLVHTEPTAIQQLQFRYFYPGTCSQRVSCSGELWFSVTVCLSASHIWVALVCSMTQLLLELLIFLVLRIDLQFPSSFLAKPETGSPTTFLKKESFMTIQHGHPHNQSESGQFSCCYLKIWLRLMMLQPYLGKTQRICIETQRHWWLILLPGHLVMVVTVLEEIP